MNKFIKFLLHRVTPSQFAGEIGFGIIMMVSAYMYHATINELTNKEIQWPNDLEEIPEKSNSESVEEVKE